MTMLVFLINRDKTTKLYPNTQILPHFETKKMQGQSGPTESLKKRDSRLPHDI